MTTEAQIEANRANAQKSTGPRTPEGKAAVAQNAVKHGLLARTAVLHGEDWEEHACFSEDLLNELYPDGVMEQELADRIVSLSWRLRRAMLNQNAIFEALYDKYVAEHKDEPLPEHDPAEGRPFDGAPLLGQMMVADFAGDRVLERMLMYERRIEGSLYRTMAEFRRLKAERKTQGYRSRLSDRPSIPDDHPIWGRSPARGTPPAWQPGQEQLCQTNPISSSLGGTGILPVNEEHGRDAHATVSAAFCQTKPIGGLDERQVLGSQEVTKNSAQAEARRAKPQETGYRLVHCVGRPAIRS